MWAPEDKVMERAASRAAQTGRVIPPSTLRETVRAVPVSVEHLAPLADYCVRIDNAGEMSSQYATSGNVQMCTRETSETNVGKDKKKYQDRLPIVASEEISSEKVFDNGKKDGREGVIFSGEDSVEETDFIVVDRPNGLLSLSESNCVGTRTLGSLVNSEEISKNFGGCKSDGFSVSVASAEALPTESSDSLSPLEYDDDRRQDLIENLQDIEARSSREEGLVSHTFPVKGMRCIRELPVGFPVLATPGETWETFRDMFFQERTFS